MFFGGVGLLEAFLFRWFRLVLLCFLVLGSSLVRTLTKFSGEKNVEVRQLVRTEFLILC